MLYVVKNSLRRFNMQPIAFHPRRSNLSLVDANQRKAVNINNNNNNNNNNNLILILRAFHCFVTSDWLSSNFTKKK